MEILLGENKYSLGILGLKKWLELDEIRETFLKAAGDGNTNDTVSSICSYISAALDVSIDALMELPWYEIAEAFTAIVIESIPKYNFAILTQRKEILEDRKPSWDYPERTWYLWSHILASSYGWTLDYIESLYFNDALALIQEILVEAQLKKEWDWGLSEIGYQYDEGAKVSRLRPLPRPSWMTEISGPPKKTKILKSLLPVGIVVRLGAEENETPVN